jgi:hypothetical protein
MVYYGQAHFYHIEHQEAETGYVIEINLSPVVIYGIFMTTNC